MQATFQALSQGRIRPEYVPPEDRLLLQQADYDTYFEFDRPVASGINPNTEDLLVEEALGVRRSWPQAQAGHAAGSPSPPGSPGAYPPISPPSPSTSYGSPPGVAPRNEQYGGRAPSSGGGSPASYTDPRGAAGRRSAAWRPGSARPYGHYADRSPSAHSSPGRSSGSPGESPRRSYPSYPTITQPPFRAGVPASGPVRRPGTAGGARRSTSTSPARSSRSPSPSQPRSGEAGVSDPEHHDASAGAATTDASGGDAGVRGSSGSQGPGRARGIRAKISGRPATAGAARDAPGSAARGARRPASAQSPGAGAGAGAGRGSRASRPWAPAAGIQNVRLDQVDEANRVALMLNDPTVSAGVREQQQLQQQQQQQGAEHEGPQPQPVVPYPQGSPAGMQHPHPTGSPDADHAHRNRSSEVSHQYFGTYRLRKHREAHGVPDHRFSQPRSLGPHAAVPQKYFSFDEAHPALADQHHARSPAQERFLQAERRRLMAAQMRSANRGSQQARSSSPGPSPTPTADQLARDVARLARVREAGRARLRQLEDEGAVLREATRQVQRRAMDAIARSAHITAAGEVRSRSPSASPPYHRSRSPSSAYGHGAGYYNAGRVSPGRYTRPVSASPAHHSPHRDGFGYEDASPYHSPAQQQGQEEYYGAGAGPGAGSPYRPVSAPPGPHSPTGHGAWQEQGAMGAAGAGSPYAPDVSEAQHILDMINQADRLPQHPHVSFAAQGGPSNAPDAADHVARASAVFASRDARRALDGPAEQAIALGAYDPGRYQEYQKQVDLEMQRRALEGGYDSDMDRDEAAQLLVEPQQQDDDANDPRDEARRLQASWRVQDEWMDEYRQRFGPEDGYVQPSEQEEEHEGRVPQLTIPGDDGYGDEGGLLHAHRPVLSDAEEQLVHEPYVPVVSTDFPLAGYASEGPDGYSPHRRTGQRLFFKSTVPVPFQFEEREKQRPKTIAKVKFEQDLAIRRQEEEVAASYRFRASPVPPAVLEPKYERMMLEAEVKRQLSHQQRLEELATLMDQPFTFHERDLQRAQEREALARAAKDPNRFQAPFRAKPVPHQFKEERLRHMMLELEAKRDSTRRRVEEARRAARERAQEEARRRQEAASRAYQERLRTVDPDPRAPFPRKPLGALPDFNSLHRQWEVQMARARANIRKRITVPQEFKLNGATPEEQMSRDRKAEERRHRIILDMQVDAELLPEMRWPYKSPRGKVRPTPVPGYLVDRMRSPGTHATNARKSSTAVAARSGAYQTREERDAVDRKASERLRAEALKRADRLLKASAARQEGAGGGGGGEVDFGLLSDVGATAAGGADQSSGARSGALRRRAAVAGRQDNPEVYIEARHAQIERKVKETVEDALLDQGIEAFRYVEGTDVERAGGRKGSRDGDV